MLRPMAYFSTTTNDKCRLENTTNFFSVFFFLIGAMQLITIEYFDRRPPLKKFGTRLSQAQSTRTNRDKTAVGTTRALYYRTR